MMLGFEDGALDVDELKSVKADEVYNRIPSEL